MITKGIIKRLPIGESNKFLVKIPIFITTSRQVLKASLDASLVEATLCYNPGVPYGYNVGDVVFVGFEDNKLEKPIILGKLFLNDNPVEGNASIKSLNVESMANLPLNTMLGDLSLDQLKSVIQIVSNLEERVNALEIKK